MTTFTTTVAAIASPPGAGAVGLLRVSGPQAVPIIEKCWRGKISQTLRPRIATYGDFFAEQNDKITVIDDVLVTFFKGPKSFTGEDVIEISCHGGILVTQKILARLFECGAVPANPGEFTQRAFLNGKMDLTQAESVMDIIGAQTELALRAAREQLQGAIGQKIQELREELIQLIAHLEAFIDFPEEDISPDSTEVLLQKLGAIEGKIQRLLATSEQGKILREGIRTAIVGRPNVGKSSLLNLLLGYERAIVSAVPGTTRDTLEEVVNLQGIPLRLIDTAGVRDSADLIEQEGIARTSRAIDLADLVLEVIDISKAPDSEWIEEKDFEAKHYLRILNKCDLPPHPCWHDLLKQKENGEFIAISCHENSGREDLESAILRKLHHGTAWESASLAAINARHQACLTQAATHLREARILLEQAEVGPEFVALELRDALQFLGEIVGQTDIEEILGQIFSTFCLGK